MPTSVDPQEIVKFETLADLWWDVDGVFKPLHMLNPCRLDYITQQIAAEFNRDLTICMPFKDLKILDIGCGGGLLCEPMARLGAAVVGIDVVAKNIAVAKLHAKYSNLSIDYRHMAIEDLMQGDVHFDVVLNMEVIEHVVTPLEYLKSCQRVVKSGGMMFCSTLNRNAKSYMLAIIMAEYILRWLPRGTHQFKKFITPEELRDFFITVGLEIVDTAGFVFNPLSWSWRLSSYDFSVNYVTVGLKP